MSVLVLVAVRCPYCGADMAEITADSGSRFKYEGKCAKRDCRARVSVEVST